MRHFVRLLALLTVGTLATAPVEAATIDLLGDKDCFGTGGACVEDGSTWVPGLWAGDLSEVDDPAFTDRVVNTSATTSWTHVFAPGAYSSASLAFRTAGIADITGPYSVFVDGVAVGVMPLDGFGHILPETFVFALPSGLVADGSATVSFTSSSADSWAIDYSELTLDGTAAPEPATVLLLGLGLAGLAARRRTTH